MSDQYAVSIRHSYTMPDETFYGYELVLWHWDVIENTWLFRATREYPVSKTVSRKQALEQALYDAEELARILRRNDDGLRACNQLLPSHARLFRHHAFRGTQSKRGREGIVMWFKRRRNEYGCPMCGRLPVIKASQTEKYHESRKVRTTLTVYRLQCPRGHISTSWFSHAALASRQWKELVDEYKGKDTK